MTEDQIQSYLAEPGSHLILNPDCTIAFVGPNYARETGVTQAHIGKLVYDALPGMTVLKPSFQKVVETKEMDRLGLVRYDIPTHVGDQTRWWEVANIPVLDPQGNLQYIVHRAENQTTLVALQDAIRRQGRANKILYVITVAIVTIGAYLAVQQTNSSHNAATAASHTAVLASQVAKETQQVVTVGRQQRFEALTDVCKETNQLVDQLKGLIISGTTSTKAYDPQLRSLGFPPYSTRLAQAQQEAASLNLVDCKAINVAPIKGGSK